MSDNKRFKTVLDNFFKRYLNTIQANQQSLPITQHHADWPSLCQQGKPFLSEDMRDCIHWQPIKRDTNNDLHGLEKALDIQLHADLKYFFTGYWSEQIDAIYQQGNLSLLLVWNEADMNRLIENQLGHALNKLRNKQPLSFFIACTDSDYIITIENDSGRVLLERPGRAIEKILAETFADFIDALEYGRISL